MVNINPGVINYQIRRHEPLQPMQRVIENAKIGRIIGPLLNFNVEITCRLARRVVGTAMKRTGEKLRPFSKHPRCAIALMDIAIEDQHSANLPFVHKAAGSVGKIVEHAVARTVGVMGVMRAASSMAGKTVFKRPARR